MPLIRRLPKRGFNNSAFHKQYAIVNLSDLNQFKSGSIVNEESLRDAKLVRGHPYGIKILGDGELKHGLTIQVEKVSASAREKIEKAGGSISMPEPKPALVEAGTVDGEKEATKKRPAKKRSAKAVSRETTRKASSKPKKKSVKK